MSLLHTDENVYLALVINRPSKINKSPYVADVKIIDGPDEYEQDEVIVHSPSLGCHGLIARGKHVIMSRIDNPKGVCKYSILCHLDERGTIIGTHPLYGNRLWRKTLDMKIVREFADLTNIRNEISVEGYHSRFDFGGTRGDKDVIMEVKSAPLASRDLFKTTKYNCVVSKDRDESLISFFPDGYRKKKGDVVSPRALKQLKELINLTEKGKECWVVYIINRNDTGDFTINPHDPIYKKCCEESIEKGMNVCVHEYRYVYENHSLKVYYEQEKRYRNKWEIE